MSSNIEVLKQHIGTFFVQLTHKLTGGEITDNGINDPIIGNPDIINYKRNQAYEVKGSIRRDRHIIRELQVEHYRQLQAQQYPLENPRVFYFLWNHNVRPVATLTEDELADALRKNTTSSLVLSFDIIEAGTLHWTKVTPKVWQPYRQLAATTRRRFFNEPEDELERIGLDSKQYEITEKRFSGKRVYGKRVAPFRTFAIVNRKFSPLELKV